MPNTKGFKNSTDSEPDFINDEGVKWWLDKSTTDYAQRKDINGNTLDTMRITEVHKIHKNCPLEDSNK